MRDGMNASPRVMCAVGGHLDDVFALRAPSAPGQSVPSTLRGSAGGCALNVAAGIAAAGGRATHAGVRGDDPAGAVVAATLRRHRVADAALVAPDVVTGRYAAMVEPDGTLALAAAAMDAYARMADLADHAPFRDALPGADALVLDANGPPGAAETLADMRGDAALALLATSPRKMRVLAGLMPRATIVFANAEEWAGLTDLAPSIPLALVTRGAGGAMAVAHGSVVAEASPPPGPLADVVGGGDAFAAGALLAHLRGASPGEALARGLDCAARCVAQPGALGWLADDGPAGTD